MNKRNILLLSGLVIILVLVLIIVFDNSNKNTINTSTSQLTTSFNQEGATAMTDYVSVDIFRSEVPIDIQVPELNEPLTNSQKQNIAVPEVVIPAAPGIDSKLRTFNISGDNNKFIPSQIIANVDDIVHINFMAVDQDYSVYFPSYHTGQIVKKGETKVFEFQANKSGKFLYYCPLCGGPETGPVGDVIIVE